ncbi:MAG: single-stranded-DNA-specific exonuclease RecJ [Flavobacteriales bacterium]|nr:single-stranded-DNA-specific exonuclease RecJ [Flavobacteriales bacterium]
MNNYQWCLDVGADVEVVNEMEEVLKVPQIIAKLLVQRGIEDFEAARDFFRPTLADLHDPFLMEDMQKTVDRLTLALSSKEKILVYGDYDVDGSTSVAMMYSFLKVYSDQVTFYQPDRYDEGYGISIKGIEEAKKNGIGLIIALDCGTRAIQQIKLANEYGIDVIVCDHHTPGAELPDAYAILNPKKTSCSYPYKELCGCGIGFKLIQAFSLHQGFGTEEIMSYLDFVAVAIGADIVPITGENRTLAYFGLKQINSAPRLGFKTLLEAGNKTSNVGISELVFTVAPRVNAAGRISHASAAVEMMLVEDDVKAKEWVEVINGHNTERKLLDQSITEEALNIILEDPFYSNSASTVVWREGWHKGVVGIVASRLIENYYKPTIVLAVKDGEATGSARSVKGYDVLEAIEQCSDLLTKFGGHKYAAGLSMPEENVMIFREKFESIVSSTIADELKSPKLIINTEIQSEDLIPETSGNPFPKLFRLVEQFAPFGPHNMRPVFLMRNLKDTGYSKIVGDDHLKLTLKCERTNQIFTGICFGKANYLEMLQNKDVDIVFSLSLNEYRGTQELQLDVKDMKPAGEFMI